jgi:co-chaperonin GroES (HSP10)
MRPLKNKVIVERVVQENTTSSGIIIKGSTGEPDKAKVISAGPDAKEVSTGDIVLLNWNAAVKSGDFYVVTEDNIIFVYEEENE